MGLSKDYMAILAMPFIIIYWRNAAVQHYCIYRQKSSKHYTLYSEKTERL